MKPLRFSLRREERTRVEPGSCGASRAAHSSKPALREARVSWREESSHSSSLAVVNSSSLDSSCWLVTGGHRSVDIVRTLFPSNTCSSATATTHLLPASEFLWSRPGQALEPHAGSHQTKIITRASGSVREGPRHRIGCSSGDHRGAQSTIDVAGAFIDCIYDGTTKHTHDDFVSPKPHGC